MNEFDLIARLTKKLPSNSNVVVGAGDDCAVLDLGVPDKLVLFKTDAVVEGVHFHEHTPPEKIGRKALGRCLSDIAAMAGTPVAAVITIGLPQQFKAEVVEMIYSGMTGLANEHGVAIVGGETTTNPAGVFISVALLGTVARGKQVLRAGAETGDAIFVTGELGGSLAGKHLDFEPRLVEAHWLAEHFAIHAMIDLSDGLAGDLPHILTASGVGAELLKSAIPISRAAKMQSRDESRGLRAKNVPVPALRPSAFAATESPLVSALMDGEDFELLFTVAPTDAVKLLDGWKKQFPKTRLSCIGKIIEGGGITIRDKQGVQPLTAHGYVHFS